MWYSGKALPKLDTIAKICYCSEISLLYFLQLSTKNLTVININSSKLPPPHCRERALPKTFDTDRVHKALLRVILDYEKSPLTMNEVAKQIGYDRRVIFSYFPKLCHDIAEKHRCYRKAIRLVKIEAYSQEVKQIAFQLHQKGEYPSECRIAEQMSKPGAFRYKKVRLALRKARQDLGLEL
jgi:hypothetical protein